MVDFEIFVGGGEASPRLNQLLVKLTGEATLETTPGSDTYKRGDDWRELEFP
jgi:hypothetical protein